MIALDVGDRRIGIAVSDPLGLTAQPLETYTRVGYGPDTRHIAEIAARYETSRILCGLPRNMDGSQGFQAEKVREFAEQLEAVGLLVDYCDERLTTVVAERAMLADDLSRGQRKKKVDMIAAAVILQSYLDAQAAKKQRGEDAGQAPEDFEESEAFLEMEDEDGNVIRFRESARIACAGGEYALLAALEDAGGFEKDESVIMRLVRDESGEMCYASLEDEAEIAAVYEAYLRESEED